ncbi:hypothetical protein BDZ94DRAFT_1266077 [Collybia nuda]|uniref:Uncharacterized protein n=1 Tax=Collybia nuda TaxID=64659 RepID=A0A9P5Y183_9AGAR|nr:hypothetical protein BDZ94DRAFT_1266077 [Collybia nuda]
MHKILLEGLAHLGRCSLLSLLLPTIFPRLRANLLLSSLHGISRYISHRRSGVGNRDMWTLPRKRSRYLRASTCAVA